MPNYSQLRQNCLNSYFQAKVGKELPRQFPEPLSVGKLVVGNFAVSSNATLCTPEITQIYFKEGQSRNLLPGSF